MTRRRDGCSSRVYDAHERYGHIMQLTCSLRLKQLGRRILCGRRPRRLLFKALPVLLGVAVSACEPGRSYERVAGGPTVYIDQFTDEQKAEARSKVAETLTRGLQSYALQTGDEFEVFFAVTRTPTRHGYVISVADQLRIEFLNDADSTRVVLVRPDGLISMPLLGSVMAAGKTPDAFARELENRYAGLVPNPKITVNATEIHSRLDDFVQIFGPVREHSVVDKVLPDGTMSLPLLRPIQARGRTVQEFESEIDAAYSGTGYNISASLIPRTLLVTRTFVFGEVPKPGRLDTDRPQTVLMAIAQAGGVLPTGSLEAIRVFYVGDDGLPRLRSINLDAEIESLSLENDMIVPKNAVIYVPPTALAKTGRLLDAVLRDILRFQGFSFTGNYLFNNTTTTSPAIVTTPP